MNHINFVFYMIGIKNTRKDEDKVKSFLEELLKYRNFASISRATSATKRIIVDNLLGKNERRRQKKNP